MKSYFVYHGFSVGNKSSGVQYFKCRGDKCLLKVRARQNLIENRFDFESCGTSFSEHEAHMESDVLLQPDRGLSNAQQDLVIEALKAGYVKASSIQRYWSKKEQMNKATCIGVPIQPNRKKIANYIAYQRNKNPAYFNISSSCSATQTPPPLENGNDCQPSSSPCTKTTRQSQYVLSVPYLNEEIDEYAEIDEEIDDGSVPYLNEEINDCFGNADFLNGLAYFMDGKLEESLQISAV